MGRYLIFFIFKGTSQILYRHAYFEKLAWISKQFCIKINLFFNSFCSKLSEVHLYNSCSIKACWINAWIEAGIETSWVNLENYRLYCFANGRYGLASQWWNALKMCPVGLRPLKMQNNKILRIRGSHGHNENNLSTHLVADS